jgi:shikimate dehydrogenase
VHLVSRWAAVIGSPVAHSLSPALHRAAWASLGLGGPDEGGPWRFDRIEQTPQTLPALVAGLDGDCLGLSVTMPCKQAVIPLLDAVEPLAEAVGAVNTVVPSGGLLTGFNTDVHGIVTAVTEARAAMPPPRSAVVLGAGATASSALAALAQMRVDDVTIVARRFSGPGSASVAAARLGNAVEPVLWSHGDRTRAAIAAADILISTVPAGAADDLAGSLVGAAAPRPDQTLLDVVYAPRETGLVRAFQGAGAGVAWGTEMLLHQAAQQVVLETGRHPDVTAMRRAMRDELARRGT